MTRVDNVVTVVTARVAGFGGERAPSQHEAHANSAPKLTASGGRAAIGAATAAASSSNERGRGPLLTAPSGPALAGHGLPGDDSAPARKLGGAETDAPRALHFKNQPRPANPEFSSTRGSANLE